MTKQDYMRLPKERLAELLEERDRQLEKIMLLKPILNIPDSQDNPPCFAPHGICTNPQKDCINCPKDWSSRGTFTTHTFTQQEMKGDNYEPNA